MTAIAVLSTGLFVALAIAGANGSMPNLRRPPSSRPRRGRLVTLVDAAGVGHRPIHVVAIGVCAAVVVAVVVVQITPVWALAVVPAGLAALGPLVWLRRRARARVAALRGAWPDALAQISGNLRSGRPLSHALIDLSLNGPPALVEPFAGLAARVQTVGLVPALEAVRDTIAEPLTDRVIEVLTLAHAEGGRVVLDILEDLGRAVEDEIAVAAETETLALEGKLNARLVFALPWIVLVVLTAGPGPFQQFYASVSGFVVIAVGALMSGAGLLIAGRLAATPEPVRVLLTERDLA